MQCHRNHRTILSSYVYLPPCPYILSLIRVKRARSQNKSVDLTKGEKGDGRAWSTVSVRCVVDLLMDAEKGGGKDLSSEERAAACAARLCLRQRIVDSRGTAEGDEAKKDGGLKKVSAFTRKLRTFTEASKDALIKEVNQLNLSKFLSEIAAAAVEAKLKSGDVFPLVNVLAEVHMRYDEFAMFLQTAVLKHFDNLEADVDSSRIAKRRIMLR